MDRHNKGRGKKRALPKDEASETKGVISVDDGMAHIGCQLEQELPLHSSIPRSETNKSPAFEYHGTCEPERIERSTTSARQYARRKLVRECDAQNEATTSKIKSPMKTAPMGSSHFFENEGGLESCTTFPSSEETTTATTTQMGTNAVFVDSNRNSIVQGSAMHSQEAPRSQPTSGLMSRTLSSSLLSSPRRKVIEYGPDFWVYIRETRETLHAFAVRGVEAIRFTTCTLCGEKIVCVWDAEFVKCPSCGFCNLNGNGLLLLNQMQGSSIGGMGMGILASNLMTQLSDSLLSRTTDIPLQPTHFSQDD